MIQWKYKNSAKVLTTREKGGVPYLSFDVLEKTGLVINGFSTRLGGVSKGDCASMNSSYTRGADADHQILRPCSEGLLHGLYSFLPHGLYRPPPAGMA